MAGTQPRRQAMGRLASSAMRRAPVGLGTPGVSGVRRRDGSQALTVPPSSGGVTGRLCVGLTGAELNGAPVLTWSGVGYTSFFSTGASVSTTDLIMSSAAGQLFAVTTTGQIASSLPAAGQSCDVVTYCSSDGDPEPAGWFQLDHPVRTTSSSFVVRATGSALTVQVSVGTEDFTSSCTADFTCTIYRIA